MAISIAKQLGLIVVATTKNKNKIDALHKYGADYVIIDNGQVASQFPSHNGVDCVLELIGTVKYLNPFWDPLSTGSYPDLESGGINGTALILLLFQERRPQCEQKNLLII